MQNDRRARNTAPALATYGSQGAQRLSLTAMLLLTVLGLSAPRAAQATVVAYDTPLPSPPSPSSWVLGTSWNITAGGSTHIDVRAFQPDHNGTTQYYTARCGIDGPTTFVIDAGVATAGSTISPKAYNITPTTSGNTLTFTLPSSKYIEINVPGKTMLCLLADPIESNPPPSSGSGIYNVTAAPYSADSTGVTSATTPIQNAINAANTAGGGIVYVPAGVFRCAKLTLKSNVQFYLANRAVLYANENATWNTKSNHFISTPSGATNVQIYGRGTIDCRGAVISGGIAPATVNSDGTTANDVAQINPIYTDNTVGVTIYGIVANDSTGFTIQPATGTHNVTITNVKLVNRTDWNWNDGIDFTDSYTGTVSHCFIKTCDDAACAKTGYFSGTGPTHDLTYDDIVADTGVGCGFSVGAETDSDIYNVTCSNFQVISCHRGFDLIHWGSTSGGGTGNWHDIHFVDWRVEKNGGSTANGAASNRGTFYEDPFHLEIFDKYGVGVGPISNVEVTRCTFDQLGPTQSYLWGDSATNNISNVCFTDDTIAGTPISGFSTSVVNKGNTSNITFNTGASITKEGESLTFTPSGCSPFIYSDANYSNGQALVFSSTAVGNYVDMTLPSVPAGTYTVQVYYRAMTDRGQYQATLDGVNQGGIQDQYGASQYGLFSDLGPKTFYTTGNKVLRMSVTGKNASSSSYQIVVDKVVLFKP